MRLGTTWAMARPVRASATASHGPGKSPTSLAASLSLFAAAAASLSSGADGEDCREPVRLVADRDFERLVKSEEDELREMTEPSLFFCLCFPCPLPDLTVARGVSNSGVGSTGFSIGLVNFFCF